MNILILGGNGFIGSAVVRKLVTDGHQVTGLGRDIRSAASRFPGAAFVRADLAALQAAGDWAKLIENHEIIINCAGALQDSLRDDLAAVQERAMLALYVAASTAGGRLIVQISARTNGPAADFPFLATKRRADEALKTSGLDYVILRPALVAGRNAYGGTALLRALASFPFVIPTTHSDSRVATVALDDVVDAVSRAVDGRLEPGSDLDLASSGELTLGEVLALHRRWLGLPPAPLLAVPAFLACPVTVLADLAGWLGWRSPLRSTAMAVMAGGGVKGGADPPPFKLRSLEQVLAQNPSGVQDVWFARLYLLKAPLILTLAMFWLVSGLIPLAKYAVAASYLDGLLSPGPALLTVLAGCVLDVVLGLGLLFRPTARYALFGMIGTSLVYLLTATLALPVLWLDPLGPLVKVLPSVLLTLTALATLDER